MRESLRGYAQGILYLASRAGRQDQVVDELREFNNLLVSQEMLAEVISDPSVPAKKRQAILGDLLVSKVDPLVIRLLQSFVGTEEPRSVLDAVGELVRLTSGEEISTLDGGFATVGRIAGYSQALLESIDGTGGLEQVEGELFRFARIVESDLRLRRVLSGVLKQDEYNESDKCKCLCQCETNERKGSDRTGHFRLTCDRSDRAAKDKTDTNSWPKCCKSIGETSTDLCQAYP